MALNINQRQSELQEAQQKKIDFFLLSYKQ